MDKKNLLKTIITLVILAVLLGGAYFVSSRNADSGNNVNDNNVTGNSTPNSTPSTQNGGENKNTTSNLKPAIDFELSDLEGNTVKLSDYKGKIVFVNFWATWCPPCIGEMPEFNEASKEFEENGDAILLAVNLTTGGARRETEEKVRKFIDDNGYTMKVLLDKTGKVAEQYKIYSIPTTYVIDKDGNIATFYEGAISKDKLMNAYNSLRE
ncbi:MAG: TlpA family protein disulfide reductase [Clostridiaceae bacterium]|jgi:cytochrome c-type biogenesis protein|nr:TlpA family protein disulfide reductase [Clostridiaceae bacterium]